MPTSEKDLLQTFTSILCNSFVIPPKIDAVIESHRQKEADIGIVVICEKKFVLMLAIQNKFCLATPRHK